MKFFIKLLFLCGISLACVYSFNNDTDCQVQECFKICKNDKKLVSVNVTSEIKSPCPDKLFIYDKNISSIESSAFENLNITTLIINTASQKLIIDQDSFTGLPILQTLKLFDGVVKLKKNLFKSINKLTSLSLTINGTEQTFENGLLELENLSQLTILKSNLSVIDSYTFLNINPTITHLVLSHNNIDLIKSNAFYSFKNLDYLQINSNNLTVIDNHSFVGLKQLVRLKISDENIESVLDKSFNDLENLETLEIMQNPKFDNLASLNINGLNKLSSLNLDLNAIKTIPNNTLNCQKNLKVIDLMNNQINKIEKDAFTGLNLTKLNLRNNKLTIIEKESFNNLTVEELDLSDNHINKISESAFNNTKITKLYLYGTKICIDKSTWGLLSTTQVFTNEKSSV